MPPRTRISNGKLAIGVLVGFAALGLGPVAHMMLNPSVRLLRQSKHGAL